MVTKLLKEELKSIYSKNFLGEQWWRAIIPELERLEGTALENSEKAAMIKAGLPKAQLVDDVLNLVKSKGAKMTSQETVAALNVAENRGLRDITSQIIDDIVKKPANVNLIKRLASNDERIALEAKAQLIDAGVPRSALGEMEQKAKAVGGGRTAPNTKTSPIHINKLNVNLEEALAKNIDKMTDAEVAVVGSEVANFGKNMVDFAKGKQEVFNLAEKQGLEKAKMVAELNRINTETKIMEQKAVAEVKRIEAETASFRADVTGKQISNIKSNIPFRKQVNTFFTILAGSAAFYFVYKYFGSQLLAYIRQQNEGEEGVARTLLKRVIQAKPDKSATTTGAETNTTDVVNEIKGKYPCLQNSLVKDKNNLLWIKATDGQYYQVTYNGGQLNWSTGDPFACK